MRYCKRCDSLRLHGVLRRREKSDKLDSWSGHYSVVKTNAKHCCKHLVRSTALAWLSNGLPSILKRATVSACPLTHFSVSASGTMRNRRATDKCAVRLAMRECIPCSLSIPSPRSSKEHNTGMVQ